MNKFDYLEHTVTVLKKCGFKYTLCELDDSTILISVTVPAENYPDLTVGIEVNNIGMIAFRCTAAKYGDSAKRAQLFELLNRFMYDFRFVRFKLEDSGDIAADCHLMCSGEDGKLIGRQILMSMLTLGDVCDKVYPHLMQFINGDGCSCETDTELEYTGGVLFGKQDGNVVIDDELIRILYAGYGSDDDFDESEVW